MAVAHVQDTPIVVINNAAGSITFPANTTVGNVVCVFVDTSIDITTTGRPVPSGGGVTTWTLAPLNTTGTTTSTCMYYGQVTSSGSATISFTDPSAAYWGAGASEFSGVSTTRIANVNYQTNSTTSITIGPLTPTSAGQLAFVGNGTTNNVNSSPYTAGAPWTKGTYLSFGTTIGDYGNTDWLITTSTTALNAHYTYTSSTSTQGVSGIILDVAAGGTVNGTATLALGPLTLTSTGVNTVKGTGTLNLGPVTLTVTGTVTGTGIATLNLGPVTLTATGTVISTGSGTGSLPLGPVTLTATGTVPATGTINGTALLALGPLLLLAAGNVIGTGTYARITTRDTAARFVTTGDRPWTGV